MTLQDRSGFARDIYELTGRTPPFEPETLVATVERLFAEGREVRVHGNGFTQLDLDERTRLHVWGDPRIPRQAVSHPIHDHVFGFWSVVIRGRMVNVVYRLTPMPHGDYYMTQAQPSANGSHDTRLVAQADGRTYQARPEYAENVPAGGRYHMAPHRFHETFVAETTVSVIFKDAPTLVQSPDGPRPRVVVPVGVQPDNEFRRDAHDQEALRRVVLEALA